LMGLSPEKSASLDAVRNLSALTEFEQIRQSL
jgi:hypothetical protein